MGILIEHLKQRINDNWLVGYDSAELLSLIEILTNEFSYPVPQKILIAESDPVDFLASFIAATSLQHHVFLCNPGWGESEWQQVFELVNPDIVWGNCEAAKTFYFQNKIGAVPSQSLQSEIVPRVETPGYSHSSLIMIPTGGSSGNIRFTMHNWDTLTASAQGFQEFFQLDAVNSICVLPLFHVSGLMQFIRSFISGGKLLVQPFKELKSGRLLEFDPSKYFISLVPTQLQFILNDTDLTAWLSRCQTVLLGGAPSWSELLERARLNQIRLSPTYGMTETASQIAALQPENFLAGENSSGKILPHAQVTIATETGEFLCDQRTGLIAIQSSSLALGYYPHLFTEQDIFYPDDIGYFDHGNLHIICRNSDKIITGGENVYPCEVEAVIRATNLVEDVAVLGLTDSYWGQIIAAIYTPVYPNLSSQKIEETIAGKLSRYKLPKLWIPLESMPRNEQGKINRKQLREIATSWQATILVF
jgi:o-succinylbenzoate---CoA ligase